MACLGINFYPATIQPRTSLPNLGICEKIHAVGIQLLLYMGIFDIIGEDSHPKNPESMTPHLWCNSLNIIFVCNFQTKIDKDNMLSGLNHSNHVDKDSEFETLIERMYFHKIVDALHSIATY